MPDSSWRKIRAVARYELIATVTRLGYLLTLIGMPVFVVSVGLVSGLASSSMVAETISRAQSVAVVDDSGLFARAPERFTDQVDGQVGLRPLALARETRVVRFSRLAEARAALARGEVSSVVHIPADYLARGKIEETTAPRGIELTKGLLGAGRALRPWLVRALLEGAGVSNAIAARAAAPAEIERFVLGPGGAAEPQDLVRELKPFLVPVGFALLLLLSIFTSASFLATGLAEEKQNRALEMLLTSLTPEELFRGKLLGLGMAALLQFLLYLAALAVPAAFVFAALELRFAQAAIALAYFVLGFFFYGSVLLTIGSLGNTQKYTQQLSGLFTFTAVVPMMMLPVLLQKPGGGLARLLTFVPFTAPITAMLRSGAGALPWWEALLSLAALAASAALVVRLSAKVFRVALLATGTTPSAAQIWAWLQE